MPTNLASGGECDGEGETMGVAWLRPPGVLWLILLFRGPVLRCSRSRWGNARPDPAAGDAEWNPFYWDLRSWARRSPSYSAVSSA